MAIPNSPNWSSLVDILKYQPSGLTKPDDLDFDVVQAISLGPLQLSNSGGKLNERYWIAYFDSGAVYIKGAQGELWGTEKLLFNETELVREIALTFDQLGRPLLFYRVGEDTLKLYWYNPVTEQEELKILAQGEQPNAGFDAPQDAGQSYSDAMLFYVRESVIYMRIQRDRFEVEYITPTAQDADGNISIVYKYHSPDSVDTSLSASLPAPIVAGDTVIATIMHRDTLTLPQGWEFLGATDSVGDTFNQVVTQAVIKVTQSDIGSTHTFTQATSQRMVLSIIAARSDSEITPEFIGKLRYSPQTPAPLPNISASYNGATIIAAASFVYALTSGNQTVTVSSPYLLETQPTRVFNRLGVASAKVTDVGIQGATMSHETDNSGYGASMATALIASSGPVSTIKNLKLMSSGMRVDNRYQVVYRHELTDYVPEPPVPPTPPVINGGYRYRLVFASYFLATGLDVQNPAVDPLEISFDITRSLTPEQKPFEQGTYGLLPECRDYALPIYSSGATLINHPMLENKVRFDNSKEVNAWTYVKQDPPIKINKRIAIEFIYGKDFKLKLFVCFNGRVTIIDIGQTPSGENRKLADGHYKLTFIDTTVSVYFNDELIMQSEFDRGSNFTEPQPIQTLIGGTNFTQRYLFKGCMFNLSVKTNEVDATFKLDQKNELVQTPDTGSSFLEIINHRRANWAYYIV